MTVDVDELKFPVLIYDERSISTTRRRYNLKSSVENFIDKGGFQGEKIIDSSGRQFKIVSVEKRGWSFFNLMYLFDKTKIIRVHLQLKYIQTMKLADVYKEIDELFQRHPRWMPKYQKEHTYELMNKAKNIKEFIQIGFADGNPL